MGIAWDGFLKLPAEVMPAAQVKLQWYSYIVRIEKSNTLLNNVASKIYSAFEAKGLRDKVTMVKGQSVAMLYPSPNHRQCGDIDLYASPEYFTQVKDILEELAGVKTNSGHPVHIDIELDGVTIELHHKLLDLYSRKKRKNFNEALCAWYPDNSANFMIGDQQIATPQPPFNEAYVLLHLYKHLILFGVGLRQVIDWCQTYRLLDPKEVILPEYSKIRALLSSFAVDYLGFEASEVAAYSPSTSQAKVEKIINIILTDGNFGQHNTKRVSHKSSSYIVRKFHSFCYMTSRCCKIWRVLPGDVSEYMFGFVTKTLGGIFTGRIHD